MRFFEYQQQAKRVSHRLLWLYCLAVIVVVALTTMCIMLFLPRSADIGDAWLWQHSIQMWATTALVVLAVVLGGTFIKLYRLSRGGRVVAEAMGGQRVRGNQANAEERRLLNVVEEMAIAAGLPMPKVYIIDEPDINAFAAGLQPTDAVIAVTRGALDALSRDELQAVIGHEFSHILNGDMNINMYLTGLLYGLEMIGLVGRWMLFGSRNDSNNDVHEINLEDAQNKISRTASSLFSAYGVMGLGLILLGFIGTVVGGWVRAAVSRQRELLADASSVQFTRQKDGLLGALMKMAEAPHRMLNNRRATQEYAHFFFGSVHEDWLTRLSATHPPLLDRIARLDPQQAKLWAKKHADMLQQLAKGGRQRHDALARFGDKIIATTASSSTPYWLQPLSANEHSNTEQGTSSEPATPSQRVLAEVKYLNPSHMQYAAWLRQNLPSAWYQACQDTEQATALMCILLLSDETTERSAQQALIAGYNRALSLRVQALLQKMPALARDQAMPLLDLILPALAELPENEQEPLRQLWQRLITADNRLDLHEWCVWTVLTAHLRGEHTPHQPTLAWHNAAADIGVVLAYSAHINDADSAAANYHAIAPTLTDIVLPDWQSVSQVSIMNLQTAVRRLACLNDADKARALQAMLSAIQADGRLDVAEREWMRALTAAWHYPMPPLLPQTPAQTADFIAE